MSSEAEKQSPEDETSLIRQNVWSVVSFDGRLASGLTYDEALAEVEKRKRENLPGLCIITDEAAERMNRG